jgi:NAD(P)-dependent dehydrogenase (short-subunit alcohol dehydrogenase family)
MKIVITGTRTGIGHHLARHLLGTGHEVWGLSRQPQDEFQRDCQARQVSFRSSQCDVAEWGQVAALRESLGEVWFHLDGLICCAGLQAPIGPAMSLDPLAWSRNIRLNLDGTFHCIRALHDLLSRAPHRAKIICFSGGGATSPRLNFSAYACAKAAVVRLVENLAGEWSGQPVDINAIAPGAINTQMTDEVLALGPTVVGEREYAQAQKQKASGGGSLEKVAGLVDFLLSADSDGISGRLISAPWDPWATLGRHREALAKSDIYCLRRIVPEDRGQKW